MLHVINSDEDSLHSVIPEVNILPMELMVLAEQQCQSKQNLGLLHRQAIQEQIEFATLIHKDILT